MGNYKSLKVELLDVGEPEKVIQTLEVLHGSFSGGDRYTVSRLSEELKPMAMPLYRHFFVVTQKLKNTERVLGVGGLKAADWASNTHILYLSAVHHDFRNRGFGKMLIRKRIEWIRSEFDEGRILVSTNKQERFKQFGFRAVTKSCDKGRAIMIMEF